jgi:hypothetical protein
MDETTEKPNSEKRLDVLTLLAMHLRSCSVCLGVAAQHLDRPVPRRVVLDMTCTTGSELLIQSERLAA